MNDSSGSPWVLAVRLRRVLARGLVRRGLAIVIGLATMFTVVSVLRGAEQARDRWGATRQVVVAVRDLAAGETVDANDVRVDRLPEAALPQAALSELPAGAVLRSAVGSGEPLVQMRLSPEGMSGTAALLPEGHSAVAVPLGPAGLPPVAVGDHVDLLAVMPSSEERAQPSMPVVEDALVVDVGEKAVSVAVPADDAPRVAFSVAHGVVVLALRGA